MPMVVEIAVKSREKKTPRALRREGTIPATLYGPEIQPMDIQLSAKEFSRVPFEDYSHLIHLKEGDTEHEALIKDVQRDFLSREVQSIQFYKIKRGHKVTMKVAIKIRGESQAVKMGADLVLVHKEAHIKCFPRHIPYFIEVDISKLDKDGDFITFDGLQINREEIEILDPGQELICKVQSKRTDHTIEKAAPAAADAAATAAAPAAAADKDKKKEEPKAKK
jgi:large subunit ribosomal protein L25